MPGPAPAPTHEEIDPTPVTHAVGIDLAWGQRRPSGVAVLNENGALLYVGAATTDDEIVAAVAPYVEGPCVVAFDAPLIVRNPTGNRPCEAALNRDFAAFDAGAHPANTSKAEFAVRPRGASLAARLDLDLDPRSTASRRAVEVYPHPATVALFRLGRTLKYKDRPGRPVAQQRAELLRLMELLESLESAVPAVRLTGHPDWTRLVADVRAAERKSELRRAEDPVDAVVCAYVALLLRRSPERLTTYGDGETGYIMTPALPAGLTPSPRGAGGDHDAPADQVRAAVRAYAGRRPALEETTESLLAHLTALLDDAGINYLSVTARTKSVASFADKASRREGDRLLYPDPLVSVTDQVGLRVITYLRSDVEAVAELLHDAFTVLDDRDMGQETAREGRFGYASRHLLVDLDSAPPSVRVKGVAPGQPVQVQVRTVLQHAWAEFEHAIRYKGTIPAEHASELDRRFTLAAGLLELADQEFSLIQHQLQTAQGAVAEQPRHEPRITPQELATFLTSQYADAGWSRPEHYGWLADLLLELGITSLEQLRGLLVSVDGEGIVARMGYRYPPGAVRRLDDALLAVYGPRYLALTGNTHREEQLRSRLERLWAEPSA